MFPTVSSIALALALVARVTVAVDLKTCNTDVQNRLNNKSLALDDPIFYFNGTRHMSENGQLQLTINGCQSTCPRTGVDLYSDMWPRLLAWLLPVLLLVGNIHLPKVGTLNRILVIMHFLGDPIDSMWSLLTKGEVWNRFYSLALRHTPEGANRDAMAKAFAAMLSAFEELTGDMTGVQADLENMMSENTARLSQDDMEYILQETADELIDSRANEVLRSTLVIINYLWTVLAALFPAIGGEASSKPGGRIGTAMFLSWIVTAVLLSNTLSGFTSRRTCLRIMERYYRKVKGVHRDLHFFPNSPRLELKPSTGRRLHLPGQPHNPLADWIDAQPWNGSVYAYRPKKGLLSSGTKSDRSPVYLLVLSILPVVVAVTFAFVIIYFTPNVGLGCRTMWVLGSTGGLLVSPVLTWVISRIAKGKAAWYATIAKDACIALPIIIIVILSSIGLFNTCFCWSAVYSRGYANAFVILDPVDERARNGQTLYPEMAGSCLLIQLIVFCLMYYIMRPGGKVFRLKEEERMDQYTRIHGDGSPDIAMTPYRSPNGPAATSRGVAGATLELPPPAIGSPAISFQRGTIVPGQGTGLIPMARPDMGHRAQSEESYGGSPHAPLLGQPYAQPYGQRGW